MGPVKRVNWVTVHSREVGRDRVSTVWLRSREMSADCMLAPLRVWKEQ